MTGNLAPRPVEVERVEQTRARLSLGEFDRGDAERISEAIRRSAGHLCLLVYEARERQAWAVLGYSSWTAYVLGELQMSDRNSRYLVEQAAAMLAIEAETGDLPAKPPPRTTAQSATKPPLAETVYEPEQPKMDRNSVPVATPADPDTGEVPDTSWAPRQLPLWLEDLRSPIEKAADEAGVDPELWVRQAVEAALAGKTPHVEQRRRQVAELASQGKSRREIAAVVGVAKSMVDKDVAAIEGQRPKASARPDDDGRCSECGCPPPTHQKWCSKKVKR